MKTCNCGNYDSNIKKLNYFIEQYVNRTNNSSGYDGMPMEFCPWCGKKLQEIEDSENF
jgi:hypothetical protein